MKYSVFVIIFTVASIFVFGQASDTVFLLKENNAGVLIGLANDD